jgi:hypothetical protein
MRVAHPIAVFAIGWGAEKVPSLVTFESDLPIKDFSEGGIPE